MPGPDNFYTWTHIWRVFVVACKMIRAVMGWALNLYYKNMEKLVERWPECWHLIYCADDLMRSEHLERIRRRIVASIAGTGMLRALGQLASPPRPETRISGTSM